MDITPPWFKLTGEACSGPSESCAGGDGACIARVTRDGYVAISNYAYCRADEVRTVPTVSGAVLAVGLVAGLGVAALVRWRRRSRPAAR